MAGARAGGCGCGCEGCRVVITVAQGLISEPIRLVHRDALVENACPECIVYEEYAGHLIDVPTAIGVTRMTVGTGTWAKLRRYFTGRRIQS
jgi:hypothetical protein